MAGERLDLVSGEDLKPRQPVEQQSDGESDRRGRFLGITFACCGVYARIYLNRDGTAYEGRCPRCFKNVRLLVGPGGSDSRFFTAY